MMASVTATLMSSTASLMMMPMMPTAVMTTIPAAANTSGTPTANGNGVGELAWGPVTGNTATLYAMSTNQGIQAFLVTVPEPVMLVPMGIALVLLASARKNRN